MSIFSLILLVLLPFQQREVIYLEDASHDLVLRFNDLQVYVDSTAGMSFEEVRLKDEFALHTQFVPAEFCTSCSYWIRLPIVIDPGSDRQWVLEFYDQTIDHITAYFPRKDGS
ncbi:MAG: 7TM-DISM domain-containing protein [Cyclobacteriaceae bacterium]